MECDECKNEIQAACHTCHLLPDGSRTNFRSGENPMQSVYEEIIRLRDVGAVHRKGHKLTDLNALDIVEFAQNELGELYVAEAGEEELEELADTVAILIHYAIHRKISLDMLGHEIMRKLSIRFTEPGEMKRGNKMERELKFKYYVIRPSGHVFSKIFTLDQIEIGEVDGWLRANITSGHELKRFQFTGFLDVHGEEIYEGDKVRDPGGTGRVIFQNPTFAVMDSDDKVWYLGGGDGFSDGHQLTRTEKVSHYRADAS